MFLAFETKAQQPNTWVIVSKDEMAKTFEKMSNSIKYVQTYSMVVTHASYENYKTNVPFERYVGYFKKDKNNYHSFLLGIHTIQNSKYRISVDSTAKIMMVANNDNNSIWDNYGLQDYKDILSICSTIKMINVGTDKLYRLEFKEPNPLTAHEFVMSAEGILKKITWYYAKEVQKDPEDKNSAKGKPRLEITFSEYKKNSSIPKNEFDENIYFTRNDKRLVLTDRYKQYELSDQRLIAN